MAPSQIWFGILITQANCISKLIGVNSSQKMTMKTRMMSDFQGLCFDQPTTEDDAEGEIVHAL